jgi:hypothetical protein
VLHQMNVCEYACGLLAYCMDVDPHVCTWYLDQRDGFRFQLGKCKTE